MRDKYIFYIEVRQYKQKLDILHIYGALDLLEIIILLNHVLIYKIDAKLLKIKNKKISYCPNGLGNSTPTTTLEGFGSGSSTGSAVT